LDVFRENLPDIDYTKFSKDVDLSKFLPKEDKLSESE
jgi:hypothetical protein